MNRANFCLKQKSNMYQFNMVKELSVGIIIIICTDVTCAGMPMVGWAELVSGPS